MAGMQTEAARIAEDGWCEVFVLLAAGSSSRILYVAFATEHIWCVLVVCNGSSSELLFI